MSRLLRGLIPRGVSWSKTRQEIARILDENAATNTKICTAKCLNDFLPTYEYNVNMFAYMFPSLAHFSRTKSANPSHYSSLVHERDSLIMENLRSQFTSCPSSIEIGQNLTTSDATSGSTTELRSFITSIRMIPSATLTCVEKYDRFRIRCATTSFSLLSIGASFWVGCI